MKREIGDECSLEKAIETAINNIGNSYAPYSDFYVSAVLVTKSGKMYLGNNIENASYSLTICAERNAFFTAVREGNRDFDYIVIVGGKEGNITDYCPPCGACRQVMQEFCEEGFRIVLAKSINEYKVYTLKELLPLAFSEDSMAEITTERKN